MPDTTILPSGGSRSGASVIRKQSCGSVTVFWLDRNLLMSLIRSAARNLTRNHEEVVRVILFGSVASDRALPSSDADILVVVRDSDLPFIDRPIRFRDHFSDIGVGADLFVYTEQELAAGSIPLAASALRTGIELHPADESRPTDAAFRHKWKRR